MQSSENIDQIAAALAAVQGNCKMVGKSAHNKFDNYRYADLEDYLAVIKPELAKEGLAVITSMATLTRLENRKTKSGGEDNVVQAELDITIIHNSGQWIRARMYGEGQDRADKSIYKATTGARKYAIASLFNLATSDDPERDETVGFSRQQLTPAQAQTSSQQQRVPAVTTPARPAAPSQSVSQPASHTASQSSLQPVSQAVGQPPGQYVKATANTTAAPVQAAKAPPTQEQKKEVAVTAVATEAKSSEKSIAAEKKATTAKKQPEKDVVKTADGGTLVGHSGDPVDATDSGDMGQKCTANCAEMEALRKEFQRMKITSRQHCLSIVNWALGRNESDRISVVTDMTRSDAKAVLDKIVSSGEGAVKAFLQKSGLLEPAHV